MGLWDRITGKKPTPSAQEPQAVSLVPGFTIAVQKKDGITLSVIQKSKPDAKPEPVTENTYYEVTVTATGENPEYPAQETPVKNKFSVSLPGNKSIFSAPDLEYINDGSKNSVCLVPSGSRFVGFKLVEAFDNGKQPPTIGKWMPAHHYVVLQATYLEKDGHESTMGTGIGQIRKSEKDSEEWKKAAESRTTYLSI